MRSARILALGLTFTPVCALGQRWADYELQQFIAIERGSPASILGLDDNGQLALVARGGIREVELREVTGATESQVQLLVDWRLLERDGGTVRTDFPILDARQTAALRRHTAAVADVLGEDVREMVLQLRHHLDDTGRGANAYSIVFSYVLDGLAWQAWEESGRIRGREITAQAPFWAGEIWATTPRRESLVGTNRISDAGSILNVTWSRRALPLMRPFVADLEALSALFEDYAVGERIVDPKAREVFAPFDLFDTDGRLTIPIIVQNDSDPVHALSRRIAATIADRAPEILRLEALQSSFGLRDEEQALVVAYHELMWDVLAALERQGVLDRPVILARPDEATESDVAALVFGVRE